MVYPGRDRCWRSPFSPCPGYILCTIRNGERISAGFLCGAAVRTFRIRKPPTCSTGVVLYSRVACAALSVVRRCWRFCRLESGTIPDLRALGAVVLFGFVFFSAAVNKLPGYLIPLLPPAFALLGLGLSRAKRPALALIASVTLLGALPPMSAIDSSRACDRTAPGQAISAWVQGLLWADGSWNCRGYPRPFRAPARI